MPYTPTTWVDNGLPAVSASNLNKLEAGVQSAQATAEGALNSAAGVAGVVAVDTFSGASDADKMSAALSYAAAQTNVPWLQLPARTFNTGSATFGVFTGMKIAGAGVPFGPKNLEISSGKGVIGKWQTSCGSGASALLQATGTVYDWSVSGVAFQGSSGSQIFRSTVNAYACAFQNLTFYGCKHAFGSTSEKFLMTQVVFDGHWTNLSFSDTQYILGGSDNQFAFYLNMNGPSATSGAGRPMMILDTMGKTDISGYLYLTCENDWIGLQVKGNQSTRLNVRGGTFEGRSSSNAATRALVDLQGGVLVMDSPHLGYVSGSGSTQGAITQSGGILILNSPFYLRGAATPAAFPLLYQTGGVARISDPIPGTAGEQVRVRWSSGTTDTIAAITNGAA